MDLKSLVRKNVWELQPYSSARDEYSGREGIFLDANENSFGSVANSKLNRYPDPQQSKLKQKIARIKSVTPEQIFLGNGSDEPIDLLIRAFCEPQKDHVMILPPTYGMYNVCANVNDVPVVKVPLTPDFQIDVEAVMSQVSSRVKLIFLCSPNNPTGNCLAENDIKTILQNFTGIVVLDEAYIDFAPDKSWLPQLAQFENLVILQTFSKAWGMAGSRLGMAFANPEIIEILNKIKYPYNINSVTQEIALKALENIDAKNQMVRQILAEREMLQTQLRELPIIEKIYPSDANFLLIKIKNARRVYEKLLEKLIIVRDRSSVMLCEDCLRITVGTPAENRQLVDTLKNLRNSLFWRKPPLSWEEG